MTPDELERILRDREPDGGRVVVISRRRIERIDAGPAECMHGVSSAADLDAIGRCDFALVIDLLEHLPKPEAIHLLARLRDCHARRILVDDPQNVLTIGEWLGLGFEKDAAHGLANGFLFDPDSPSRRREWNTPENWAHPENFDRDR